MKVSKRSWHYRLNTWRHRAYVPTNLCSHFWNTVGSMVVVIMIGAILTVGVAIVALAGFAYVYEGWMEHTRGTATVHIILSGILVMMIFAWLIYYWNTKSDALKALWRKHPHPSETLVGQYISARKRRICPLIELED